ncbi:MAG: PH domain-containing protein [Telluria sp.]
MAKYVQSVLSANEKVEYEAKVSVWSLWFLIFLGVVFLMLNGLGIVFFVVAYLKYISTELAITNKRVIAKSGFISRKTVEINLSKIESMQVEQGLFGRMLNYGSLVVAGAGTPQAPIPGISDPIRFRNAFVATQEAQEQAKIA